MRDIRALVTSRPWVVLPIESNVRELHARILLAAVASELGLGVVIGRAAELPRYLPTLPQAVLLYMSAVFPDVFSLARRNRHTPTVIDEEGLIYRNEADYLRRRIALSSLEQCERFFAWGAVHRRVVASVAPHLADRILPVGNPRIDLLRPSLREIHRPEAEALTRDHGRFILVNTNLGTFNHQLGPEARVREWAARGWSDSEEGAELLRRTVDYQHRMFDEFARLIEALADGLPKDVAVVVRPHPSERLASWQSRLGHLDTVKIIHKGGVVPWLLAAEALVHNSCTTGIEASLLGRHTFTYLPFRDPLVEGTLPNSLGRGMTDSAALVDSILDLLRVESVPAIDRSADVLADHIACLSGRLSSEVIAEQLQAVAPPPSELRNMRAISRKVRVGRAIVRTRSFASAAKRRNLRGERALGAYIKGASPGISTQEIERVLSALSLATGRFRRISCASLAPDLVVLGEPS